MSHELKHEILPRKAIKLVQAPGTSESGIACLSMISSYYGLTVDSGILRRQFNPSAQGITIKFLVLAADRLGLAARALQIDPNSITSLSLPSILNWGMGHYVVLEAVSGKSGLVHDPDRGTKWIPIDEISKHFHGEALELAPAPDFEMGTIKQRLRLRNLWSRITGLKRAVTQTILLTAFIQIFAIASPYYLQLAIDSALPEQNLPFLAVLAAGFGLFAVLNGVATLLRSSVLLSLGASFGYGLASNLGRKLFRLPVDWFGNRHLGEILLRFRSIVPIQRMLTENAPAALVDGGLTILTLILMFFYSAFLASISASILVLYAISRAFLFMPQRKAQEESIIESGHEHSILIETIRGVRAIRLSGREASRRTLWQSRMVASVNAELRYQRFINWQSAIQVMLFGIENVLVIWLGTSLVIQGGFTIGMLFAYLAYKVQFLTTGSSLIDKFAAFKMLDLPLERISDIALCEDDVSFRCQSNSRVDLIGRIEIKNVHFSYGSSESPVLRGIDLTVAPGESLAITGPSGGGKSTLVSIILGLTEPTQGKLLVDGVGIEAFGYQNYHRQVSAVLQDDTLFAGSIAENISMFDEDIDMAKVESAASAAAINTDIKAMPRGYDTLVGEMGAALSGGQRQRIILARALYREPKVLVIDEGTSHLDEEREKEVNRALSSMGITRIIIAHRKETIASADRVLFLVDGVLKAKH